MPAQADGHRRDWLAEARRLTHSGDGGGGRGPRHGRTTRGRRGPGRLIALGVLVLILLGIGWFLVSLFQPFKGDGEGAPVRVTIPQGSSLSQIADRLEQSGVIDDAGFFQLRAQAHRPQRRPPAGQLRAAQGHELRRGARRAFRRACRPNVVQVSIPEGLSRKEIAPLTRRPARQLRARHSALALAQPARLRREGRHEPRGLPLPGHLRAQEGPAGGAPASTSSSPSSSATSTRST